MLVGNDQVLSVNEALLDDVLVTLASVSPRLLVGETLGKAWLRDLEEGIIFRMAQDEP